MADARSPVTARTASLGMYDRAEVRWANDRIWAALAAALVAAGMARVPDALDRTRPPAACWADPDLLVAHCCGYPMMGPFRTRLRYVATPVHAVPGCDGALYRSRIVVRADDPADALSDLRGRRAAINDRGSNSGMNLLRAAVAPLAGGAPFFAAVIETGAHDASVRAVTEGTADVAAIDTVSFAHLARAAPDVAARIRTIGWTAATPGLPLVTAAATSDADLATLRRTLRTVLAHPDTADARQALFIDGIVTLPERRYRSVLTLERRAEQAGYPVLT